MQTSVGTGPDIAYEGKVHTGPNFPSQIVTLAAAAEIPYGKGVSIYADAEVTLGSQRGKLPAAAGDLVVTNFWGVAIADPSKMATQNAYGAYAQYDAVPVMRKGLIWVVSADAVDDLTKAVYCRRANGAAAPAGTLGSFRATTDADYTAIPSGAQWVAGTQIGSVYYGLLALNLV